MTRNESDGSGPPLPFAPPRWPRRMQPDVAALWAWHRYLWTSSPSEEDIEQQVQQAEAFASVDGIPEDISHPAFAVSRRHGLSSSLLGDQIRAATRIRAGVRCATTTDLNALVQDWAGSFGRLLSGVAGLKGRWQGRYVDELSRGFFLARRLAKLPEDVAKDRLFIPLDELDQAGVTLAQLREGPVDEPVRKLLWKQEVRIRDALAQGQELHHDLRGPLRRLFRREWLTAMEVLHRIVQQDYDVWARPVTLPSYRRLQVRVHALIARKTFQRR